MPRAKTHIIVLEDDEIPVEPLGDDLELRDVEEDDVAELGDEDEEESDLPRERTEDPDNS